MKHSSYVIVVFLGIVGLGCGGSGGSSSSTGANGTTSLPQVEAVLADPTLDPSYIYQDITNIQEGDSVKLQLVSYTKTATGESRNVLTTSEWISFDPSNTYGTLGNSTGIFQAANRETATLQPVATLYNGVTYTGYFGVKPRQVRVRAKVVDETSGKPIRGVVVQFYGPQDPNNSGSPQVLVGSATTAYDGTFRASVPTSTTQFNLKAASLSDVYYPSFKYDSFRYDAEDTACRAVFPVFAIGDRELPAVIQVTPRAAYATKPSADGCGL